MKKSPISLGQRYGRLLVVSRGQNGQSPKRGHRSGWRYYSRWLCQCDCGNNIITAASSLTSGSTRSCGCLLRDIFRIRNNATTHGMSRTKIHAVWANMKSRCNNSKNKDYADYGGRGIKVCARWLNSFENFFADMGKAPPGRSLDRYPNNNGNYEPDNCRWATQEQQHNNTRISKTARLITYQGETFPLAQWTRRLGIDYDLTRGRLNRSWSIERAFTTSIKLSPQI